DKYQALNKILYQKCLKWDKLKKLLPADLEFIIHKPPYYSLSTVFRITTKNSYSTAKEQRLLHTKRYSNDHTDSWARRILLLPHTSVSVRDCLKPAPTAPTFF
uniref:Uncharacterized protein n=1 Tax=Aegilops tauschii subsp. strangulata TaxID=200361 RepID=A0A453RQF0_AEGTS